MKKGKVRSVGKIFKLKTSRRKERVERENQS